MKLERLKELFEEDDSYEIKKGHNDVEAFVLLQSILRPAPREDGVMEDMVSCAGHDQIWLNANLEELAEKATEEQIIQLRRCGVWIDSGVDSLSMFA